jgi:cell division protein FtsI/penicillin-binding protein 2
VTTEVALYRDGRRRTYARAGAVDRSASQGQDASLTLDVTIQHFLESALSDLAAKWEPMQACGIVLDPHSGEILALANRPTFDPNRAPANANLAIQGLYEPGSFFKPFTVAWALRYAAVGPEEILDMPLSTRLPGDPHPVRDTHFVGPGDVRLLLSDSSNTGAAGLAHRLGRERMRDLFAHLFPDRPGGTRCGLPFETRGGPHLEAWPWWRAHRAGFGQGFHVTPMQMISVFAAFARDDGCAVEPTIHLDRTGPPREVAGACVCDPLHLGVVREGLEGCVAEGTARTAFAGFPWTAAAKTATAQQKGRVEGRARELLNCSLAAYAPAGRPQVVALILAQMPSAHGVYGGTVAAPHVREVLERTLAHWKVPVGDGVAPASDPTRMGETR